VPVPAIAVYVSGHGYGHSTRTAEVLREVRALAPEVPIVVVGTTAERIFEQTAGAGLAFRNERVDVGLVQRGALVIDVEATLAAWDEFQRDAQARVAREAAWLRQSGARVVLADIPPLAFAAAQAAGLPAVGLSNFSWDWIYRHLARHAPGLARAAEAAARDYATAALLLELPFAGDLSAFPRREQIPLVARRASLTRQEGRRRLGLGSAPAVLVSFGGLGMRGVDLSVLAPLRDVQFLTEPTTAPAPANVRVIAPAELSALGMGYVDLVASVDVVVTKPGYGIVSEAISARTRMVYTERGDFPEYPILVQGMSRWLPAVHVTNEDLRAGELRGAIERVLALPFPDPPDLGGAKVAAQRVLALAS